MKIDDWWAGQGNERYWMEITNRGDLGGDLLAPQANPDGKPIWHYTLVQYTAPGDIVFHWHKSWAGTPAIVGWSEVVGPLSADAMEWQAQGTVGRARGHTDVLPNWVMPLGGFTEFERPVTTPMLNPHFDDVMSKVSGKKYGPFIPYQPGVLRATQAYLTKFPSSLVPRITSLAKSTVPTPPDDRKQDNKSRGTKGGQGRLADPVLRKAIENYAVDAAIQHYKAIGATNIEILGKPYDLKLTLHGQERHIEVKGTTVDGAVRVVLTVGEVNHALEWPRTDLFVLDGIEYRHQVASGYKLTGGTSRVWVDWQPAEAGLHPTEFSYDLPHVN